MLGAEKEKVQDLSQQLKHLFLRRSKHVTMGCINCLTHFNNIKCVHSVKKHIKDLYIINNIYFNYNGEKVVVLVQSCVAC